MIPGWKRYSIAAWLIIFFSLISLSALAANLTDIKVSNGKREARISIRFDGPPIYTIAPLLRPEDIMLDIEQSGNISELPLIFNGQNLLKKIRAGRTKTTQNTRLVLELTKKANFFSATQREGNLYTLVLILTAASPENDNGLKNSGNTSTWHNPPAVHSRSTSPIRTTKTPARFNDGRVVIAIDAGHGGQDPGAVGQHGLKEKNVTMSIAHKLNALLKRDPMFQPVLTRNGDYFLSVAGRSDVARKQGANMLVSIHADAAPNRSATGASVWVLSNRRASNEMGNWLEQHEKQSELLGGAGNMLANTSADPYLSQAVLDLQFGHSQRVGYDVAVKVLHELQHTSAIHKYRPEHASLGVLRSPDIPSLLVETGFISNSTEERLLGNSQYQDKLVHAIYSGLRNYFLAYPLQVAPKIKKRPQQTASAVGHPLSSYRSIRPSRIQQPGPIISPESTLRKSAAAKRPLIYTVQYGDTLSAIASYYGVSMAVLREINALKKDVVWVGQRLKIPAPDNLLTPTSSKSAKPTKHKVKQSDTLSTIAAH